MEKQKFLIVEDDLLDLEIIKRELENSLSFPFQIKHVSDKKGFLENLKKEPDIILCDYNLGQYTGFEALKATLKHSKLIPFIMVTGSLSEEKAADVIKAGAWEYVVKERLYRLPSAIEKSLVRKKNSVKQLKLEFAVKSLNRCLLSLQTNSRENIKKIIDTTGDILDCSCLLYNRLDQKRNLLSTWAIWNEPENYHFDDKPEGHICYDVIRNNENEPVIFNDLTGTKYEKVDPNVIKYQLKSYLGYPIKLMGRTVGSFCLCDTEKREFSEVDIQIMTMFGQAVANEEQRLANSIKLQESEERFRSIYQNTTIGLYRTNPQGDILMANPTLVEMLGYDSVEELKKRNLEKEGYHPEYNRNFFKSLFKDNAIVKGIEAKWKRKDGSNLTVLESAFAKKDENGKVLYYDGAVEDITEKKIYEEQIKHLNRILLSIRKIDQLIVKEKDEQILIEKICSSLIKNGSYENAWIILFDQNRHFSGSAQAGLGKIFNKIEKQFQQGKWTKCAQKVLETGKIQINNDPPNDCPECPLSSLLSHKCSYTNLLLHKNIIYGLISVSLPEKFVHNEKEINLFLEIADDIAFALHDIELEKRRKQTEQSLITNEKKFRSYVENAPYGIFITDNIGNILNANKEALNITGYKNTELLQMSFLDLIAETDQKRSAEYFSRIKKNNNNSDNFSIIYQNGITHYWDIRSVKLSENRILSFTNDVTKQKKAEEELKISEERFELAMQATQDGLFDWNLKNDTVYLSPAWKKMLDFQDWEFQNNSEILTQIIHPEDRSKAQQNFYDLISRNQSRFKMENRIKHRNGDWINVLTRAQVFFDKKGKAARILGTIVDVTDRKKAEQSLKEQENLLRNVVNTSPILIYVKDKKGKYLFVNNSIAELYNTTQEEMLGKTDLDFSQINSLTKKEAKAFIKDDLEVINGQKTKYVQEEPFTTADGKLHWFKTTKLPIRLKNKQKCLLGISEDITEKIKNEKMLRQRQQAFESSIDGIGILDSQEKYTYLNESHIKIYGYEKDKDLLGKSWQTLYSPKELKRFTTEIIPQLKSQKHWRGEAVGKKKNGTEFPQELSLTLLEDGGIICIVRDITERKQAEKEYKEMIDSMNDSVLVIDENSKFVEMNKAAIKTLGYSRKELLSMTPYDIDPTLKKADVINMDVLLQKGNQNLVQREHKTKDGRIFPVEISSTVITYKGQKMILSIARDITERKQYEEKIKNSEQRFKFLSEATFEGIIIHRKGFLLDANDSFLKLVGYDREEAIGKNLIEYVPSTKDRAKIMKNMLKFRAAPYTITAKRKDGSSVIVELEAKDLMRDGKKVRIAAVRDVTEKVKALNALKKSEENLSNFFNANVDMLWVFDQNGKILDMNKTVKNKLKYKEKELLGRSISQLYPEKHREQAQKIFQEMIQDDTKSCTLPMLTKKGKHIPVESFIAKGAWNREKVFFGISKDLSELKLSEEKFAKAFQNSPNIIGLSDLKTHKYIEVNQTFYDRLGFAPEEVIGKTAEEVTRFDVKRRNELFQKLKNENKVENEEAIIYTKEGKPLNVLLSAEIIELHDRKLNFTTAVDITELVKLEKSIRDSEKKFRSLVNNLPVGISRSTPQGDFISANPAFLKIYGYSSLQDLKQINAVELYETATVREKLLRELQNKKVIKEYVSEEFRKNGKKIWVSTNYQAIFDKTGNIKFIDGVILDITKRMEAQKTEEVQREISLAVSQTENLNELYNEIKKNINKLMDTTNFYVAIYNQENDTISLPYHIDQKDNFENYPAGKTLTAYVIKTARPLIVDAEGIAALEKQGKIETIGAKSKIWLGVPLKVEDHIIGMISVQSYTNPRQYSKKDLRLLEFVSGQIAQAIDRKQKQEEILRSLREKEVLLKEVHHRVKNNMNVITSLLNLQSHDIKNKEDAIIAFEESKNRIYAMSMVHKLLYEVETFSEIRLKEYLKILLNKLIYSYKLQGKITWTIDIDQNVNIDINKAVPFGLIFNEIVTNSLKYAFVNRDDGNISVKINRNEDDVLHFIFSDNGTGIDDLSEKMKSGSLGFRLIFILSKQIDGNIKVTSNKGTRIDLLFNAK